MGVCVWVRAWVYVCGLKGLLCVCARVSMCNPYHHVRKAVNDDCRDVDRNLGQVAAHISLH